MTVPLTGPNGSSPAGAGAERRANWPLMLAAVLAIAGPALWAPDLQPSPSFFNNLWAWIGWGVFLLAAPGITWRALQRAWAWPRGGWMTASLLALCAWIWWTSRAHGAPDDRGLPAAAAILAAGLLFMAARTAAQRGDRRRWAEAIAVGALVAALGSCFVGWVQWYQPEWVDGYFFSGTTPNRLIGNIRQPNQLAIFLIWGALGCVLLVQLGKLHLALAVAMIAPMMWFLNLTGSRAAFIAVCMLGVFALFDRTINPRARATISAIPILLSVFLVGFAVKGYLFPSAESPLIRPSEGGLMSRWVIIQEGFRLAAENPWLGVGWGRMQFVWVLNPSELRLHEFFDHAHNLPVHLAAELGFPLAGLLVGGLMWLSWRAYHRGVCSSNEESGVRRGVFFLVAALFVPTLLEYPLWYAYFLFPAAVLLGLAATTRLGPETAQQQPLPKRPTAVRPNALLASVLILGGTFALSDYLKVVQVYVPIDSFTPPPLAQRMAIADGSLLYAGSAYFAPATRLKPGPEAERAARITAHHNLEANVLKAWMRSLHAMGEIDKARYLAARFREFRGEESAALFFAECDSQPAASKPWFCQPPVGRYTHRDFEVSAPQPNPSPSPKP